MMSRSGILGIHQLVAPNDDGLERHAKRIEAGREALAISPRRDSSSTEPMPHAVGGEGVILRARVSFEVVSRANHSHARLPTTPPRNELVTRACTGFW
jgi:hypothetical protein